MKMKFLKLNNSIRCVSGARLNLFRYAAMVVVLFTLGVGNAWAGGSYNTALRTMVDATDTGKGLVYANTSKTASVTDNSYSNAVKSDNVKGSNGANQNLYGWAKPARSYVFSKWVSYDYDNDASSSTEEGCTPQENTGTADLILVRSWGGNAGNDVCGTAKASWNSAPSFTVVYKQPVGGTYSVQYGYLTVNSSNKFATTQEQATLTPSSEDWTPTGVSADQNGLSYAADVVTLTSNETSFDGWYENGVKVSDGSGTNHSYTYPITKNANVTAMFKYVNITAPEEQTINTTNCSADVVKNILFSVEEIGGSWSASDFNATISNSNGSGSITIGAMTYSSGTLTVPVTYNANGICDQGTDVILTVAPTSSSWGESASVVVKGLAEEVFDYDACVIDGSDITTGSLADMLAYANMLSSKPTLQIKRNVTASATLQVKKSMTLDLNSKVLSATTLSTLILVQGDNAEDKIEFSITDNSYLKAGKLQMSNAANAIIAGVKIADANKVTFSNVDLTVNNTAVYASNTSAKAYGIWVAGATGNLVMNTGAVHSHSEQNAYGVYVESGNATVNGAIVEAEAAAKAYAFYSNANSNITGGRLSTSTTTGDEAYALVVNAGTTTTDGVTMETTSAQGKAYGVNIAGGVAYVNGGTITATGSTNTVFGVNVQAGARATVQQKPVITATGGSQVCGIQNAGILLLLNGTVTATSTTTDYATAVNTASGAVSTTIEGGTYFAQSATGYVYGLYHQYGTLSVDGGTFSAEAAGDNVYGGRAGEDATIANATFNGETKENGKTVYGFVGGVANKNISLTNCTIKAKSATSTAYSIYSRANVTATGCTLEAKTSSTNNAYALYAENGANTLSNTNATVEAYTTGAYGVQFLAGTLTINGGTYEVTARQATASSLADSEVYGVKVADGKTANISNASFTVKATSSANSRKAYGIYTGTGNVNSTASSYTVSASQKAYGVYGDASSTLTLQDNTISATTTSTTTAYGIYSNSTFSIKGDKVTSDAQSYDSYPLCFGASAVGTVQSGWFKALGTPGNNTQIVAPINKAANNANVKVQGGFFNDLVQLRFYVPTGYDIYGVDPDAAEHAEGYYYTVNDHVPYENVCYITEVSRGFPTLEDAFDYARNHSGTNYNILMIQPYTLPAGNYSLPSNATLVVPYKASQTQAIGATPQRRPRDMEQIAENRLLTIANGANVDVAGKIEVSAEQYVFNVGGIGYVQGPYGRIHLEEGSTITLNNGARIYAWGYITGQGEIRVKNGAAVHEQFQLQDMKGTSDLSSNWMDNDQKTFPVNQYYIQNVEAPTKYYYGSQLLGYTGFTTSSASTSVNVANGIKLVGTSDNFFNVDTDDESSWVRKRYDPTTDRIIWETNSSASLGSMNINIQSYAMNTKDYILPITNNMTIHILSGKFKVTQSTVFLPGATLEIDKTATLQINGKDTKNQAMGLYLYDQAQWTTNASLPVYSPSWVNGVCPRAKEYSKMKDAAIYVKGKIEVDGAIYTSAGGAAIYSDPENAGTIVFNAAAGGDKTIYKTYATNTAVTTTSAQLRNGGVSGSTFTATKGVAAAGDTYAYMDLDKNGNYEWTNLATVDECVVKDKSTNVYYAKPKDYVAITSATEDGDHLFHSVTGNRLFIQQTMDAGCQWWEVTRVGETSVYHCATNDTYYEYKNSEWQEKVVHVTFYFTDPKNDAADKKKVLEVNYGAKPDASIVSNPSKGEDAAATYQFYGWKSNNTQAEYAYTAELEDAFEDMYYLPVFTSITKKYTITLNDANNGAAVPVEVPYGEVPSYTPKKDADAQYTYTFEGWTPALQAVNGTATYTAQWSSVINRYTITWMDGETLLETDKNQLYGTTTSFDGTTPSKDPDNNYAYTFSGWLNSLTGNMRANNETVTGAITYTAQYNTTPRYMITFANYDGEQLQKEAVTHGAAVIYKGLTPGRVRDLDGYYKFTGWKNSNGTFYAIGASLPSASAKETYTAQYEYVTELYLITLNNVDGEGTSWSGKFGVGAMPFYNRDNNDVAVEPAQASTDQYEYTFTGWSPELQVVSGEATYTAQFEQHTRKYEITFANLDGNGASQTIEVEYGQTPVSPVTPEKVVDHTTYAFTGWNTTIVPVAGEATYTAQFSSTGVLQQFTITFDPDNGGATQVTNVAYGTMPTWSGSEPTKPATAQYTYTFAGWYPEVAPVTGEETYSAQYTQTLNKYTVRFMNYDSSELQSSEFVYGATPTYSGETPKKPADVANRKVYTFDGWSSTNGGAKLNTLPAVNGAATYYAHYSEATFVASVTPESGTPYYATSWADAYNHISDGCTLKLYADATPNENTAINKNMTLDLNGYTLSRTTSSSSNTQLFNVTKALIIVDSDEGGKITYSGSARYGYKTIYVNGSTASLIINSGSIQATNTRTSSSNNGSTAANAVEVASSATLTINGGELIATSTKGNARAVNNNNTNVTITGGKLKVTGNATLNIFNSSYVAKVTASGGYYSKDPGSISIVTGYEKVPTSELSGYTHKVAPRTDINYTVKHWKQNVADNEYTEMKADAQTLQGTTDTYTEAEAKNYTGFTAQTFAQGKIAGDGTTVVNIYYNRISYTVTWKDMSLSPQTLQEQSLRYGATIPAFDYQKQADEQFAYIMREPRWLCSGEDVTAQTTVNGNMELRAQYDAIPLTLVVTGERTIEGTVALNSTTVRVSGALRVAPSASLTTTDLILEAQANTSGEITGNVQLNQGGHAYFDLYINDTEPRHWHAFSVPFQIDLRKSGHPVQINGETLTLGRGYDIVFYDGAVRAAQGKVTDCWKYVEDPSSIGGGDSILYPGKAYMIASASRTIEVVRFTKADGASLAFSGTINVTGGDGDNGGWNGIGNPTTYHAIMNAGPTVAQVHDGGKIGADGYEEYDIDNLKYVVGKAVFVQARSDKSVVISPADEQGVIKPAAPARRNARADINKEYLSLDDYYKVSIAQENNANTCNVYVLDEEDKEDAYVIGHDLSKFGLNTALLQMWVNRYDNQLSLNTTAPIDGVAYYPLGINAPQSCEYTISLQSSIDDEHALYLTCDGEVIWNLSEGAFLLYLDKGTTSRFGLRLVEKAPQVATGMDEAVLDAQGETQKILINDHVYIIRGNNVYTIDGQLVK